MTLRIKKPWQVDLIDLLRARQADPGDDTGGTTGGERERDSERVILLAFDYPADMPVYMDVRESELAWAQWLSLAEEHADGVPQEGIGRLDSDERRGASAPRGQRPRGRQRSRDAT